MIPVRWGIRGSTNGNNISLRFRGKHRLAVALKTIHGQMISLPTNKAKNFNSFPKLLFLGLLLLLKTMFLFLEKKRLSTKLIFVKPMLLEGLRKRLARALNKIGLRMRIGFLQIFFEKNDVYPQYGDKQANHQR